MGGAMGVEPLLGVDLVRAQDLADLVVEDLRSGAGERPEPGVHHAAQVVGERLAVALRALGDLERGEAVHVDVGRRLLHGSGDVEVVLAVEVGVDASLQAHLGRAHVPRLTDATGDLLEGQEVRLASEVEGEWTFRESAELALERAHVRVVDVAVRHPGDVVAHGLAAQLVGQRRHGEDLGAAGREQGGDLVLAHLLAGADAVEHRGDGAGECRPLGPDDADVGERAVDGDRGRLDDDGRIGVGARVPDGGAGVRVEGVAVAGQ